MMEIQRASWENVDAIVKIYEQAFPHFFLTTLGSGFLHLYYSCMCVSAEALTLCAFEDGNLVGLSSTALKSAGVNTGHIKKI